MHQASEQENLTSQWITSLAISVVCCAALFLVFAGYMMDLHEKTATISVRLEFYQERQNQLTAELDALRRPIPVMPLAPAAVPPSVPNAVPNAVPNMAPPAPAAQPNAAQPVKAPEAPAPNTMKPVTPAPSAPAMQPAPPAAKPVPGKAPAPGKTPAPKP